MEIRMNYQEFKNAVLAAAKENNLKDYELYYTESSGTSVPQDYLLLLPLISMIMN